MEVDETFVDPHLVPVPSLGSLSTRRLSGRDTQNLGRHAHRSLHLQLFLLGPLDQISTYCGRRKYYHVIYRCDTQHLGWHAHRSLNLQPFLFRPLDQISTYLQRRNNYRFYTCILSARRLPHCDTQHFGRHAHRTLHLQLLLLGPLDQISTYCWG